MSLRGNGVPFYFSDNISHTFSSTPQHTSLFPLSLLFCFHHYPAPSLFCPGAGLWREDCHWFQDLGLSSLQKGSNSGPMMRWVSEETVDSVHCRVSFLLWCLESKHILLVWVVFPATWSLPRTEMHFLISRTVTSVLTDSPSITVPGLLILSQVDWGMAPSYHFPPVTNSRTVCS